MNSNTYYSRAKVKHQIRKKQVRRNILLLILSTIILSSILVLFASMSIQASDMEHQQQVSYKYFKSIYIDQGDTLWSIAETNMDEHYSDPKEYINEVKRMNSLTSDRIECGSYLIVPYFSSTYIID